jgi:hypothetical protein
MGLQLGLALPGDYILTTVELLGEANVRLF